MLEANGESSLFKDEQQKSAFISAYDRIMTECWPVPFEEREIATRFGTTHVISSGPANGKPLVLLPGGGGCSPMWHSIIAPLVEAGYRCYCLDRVGDVGKSTFSAIPDDSQTLADWLLDCMDVLQLEKPPMIGLSYGGFMNINFARIHPERISLIIMLTPGGIFARLRRWWVLRMTLSILSGFPPLIRNAYSYIAGGRKPDRDFFELARLSWVMWKGPEFMPPVYSDAELRAVTHPSLLLVGDKEVIYNPHKVLQRAKDTMPDVEVELIPNGGHTLSLDEPQAVSRRIIKFLADRD
ncbi:alpha/beta hydrolase [Pseudomaricurvus alkylphenolicus]|uniref:alpha/beta fold hydrolase n=1 Tax=Pseudomaricurvus alkylphenolicus TaxID=1306991 RepID=UPI001422C21D|nr:alpha/beta hydrolase [Pseudomaricurvus alkylphenolicus]NIB42432.1 alpha/beta hydrolase [Pseudomaricurvus alkylphenolicus]